jgi:nucleoside-diphosphate-sugar epimerase
MIYNNIESDKLIFCITGVCGFIGRSTALHLLKNGATVVGVDPSSFLPPELKAIEKTDRFIFLPLDFLSARNVLEQALSKRQDWQKIFIHLAGMADANACNNDPSQTYYVNVHMTWEVARFCAQAGIDICLLASTGYVYGTSTALRPSKETDPLKPDTVYTATKIAAEHLLALQSQQEKFQAIIMRFGNVYGKEGSIKTVLGTIIDQARKNLPIRIKDPTPIRDFIHVDDIAEAVFRLSRATLFEQVTIVNVGTGKGTRIGAVVAMVEQMRGKKYKMENDSFGDTLVLDPAFLYQLTGWIPQISINQGLQQIVTVKDT